MRDHRPDACRGRDQLFFLPVLLGLGESLLVPRIPDGAPSSPNTAGTLDGVCAGAAGRCSVARRRRMDATANNAANPHASGYPAVFCTINDERALRLRIDPRPSLRRRDIVPGAVNIESG